MSDIERFEPERILAMLQAAGVRFIVIGGLAAQVHGSPTLTRDLDLCYALDRENLEPLARVLTEIGAVRRGLPADTPPMPPIDVRTLGASALLTLETAHGSLDLLAAPDPGLDFGLLMANAGKFSIGGVPVLVAGLDDLIAMKRAAGRPKDRIELEILGALREEIDQAGGR